MEENEETYNEQVSDEEQEEDVNSGDMSKQNNKKMFMPPAFNKARRNVTKLVNSYFNALKDEIKLGAQLHLDRLKIADIEDAITSYVGLRYNDRPLKLDLKLNS